MDHPLFTGFFDALLQQGFFPLLGIVFVIMLLKLFLSSGGKKRRKSKSGWVSRRNMADPGDQMNVVAQVEFERQTLMNKTEYRVFHTVEKYLRGHGGGYRLMSQTSLGEVLTPKVNNDPELKRQALASINSKRIDLAIFDRAGLLALAIEVQGSGHYTHNKTFMRDAVKREALRRAGVEMLEITPDWDNARIEKIVSERLGLAAAA